MKLYTKYSCNECSWLGRVFFTRYLRILLNYLLSLHQHLNILSNFYSEETAHWISRMRHLTTYERKASEAPEERRSGKKALNFWSSEARSLDRNFAGSGRDKWVIAFLFYICNRRRVCVHFDSLIIVCLTQYTLVMLVVPVIFVFRHRHFGLPGETSLTFVEVSCITEE